MVSVGRAMMGRGMVVGVLLSPTLFAATDTLADEAHFHCCGVEQANLQPDGETPSEDLTRSDIDADVFFQSAASPFESYKAIIRQHESSGRYDAVNRFGFAGAYQFSLLALIELGRVRPEVLDDDVSSAAILAEPENWLIDNGRDGYLANAELQDADFEAYTRRNFDLLLKNGVITNEMSFAEMSGWLMVAHLIGPSGARRYKMTGEGRDGNNAEAATYFERGFSATLLAKGAALSIGTAQVDRR